MAQTQIPSLLPNAPTPNSLASPDNGLDSVINPSIGFAQQLQGAAAAANAPAPAAATSGFAKMLAGFAPPARPVTVAPSPYDAAQPLAAGMPGSIPARDAADPNSSGLRRAISGVIGHTDVYAQAQQLKQGTDPIARFANFVGGDDATKAAMDQSDEQAKFFARPDVQGHLRSNPADIALAKAQPGPYAKALQAAMDLHAAHGGVPVATTSGVPVDNGAKVQQHADAAGVHFDVAHPFTENHQYDEQGFVDALRGKLNWGQAAKLWQMQHYVPPAAQAAGQYLGLKAAQVEAANNAVIEGRKNNLATAELNKLKETAAQRAREHEDVLRAVAVPAGGLYATAPATSE